MTSNELKHKAKLQEWALTVQECRSSGKPVKQWCIENKIKVITYYRWEREILGDAGKNRNKPERNGTAVFAELPASIKPYQNSLQHCIAAMYQSKYILEWTQSC